MMNSPETETTELNKKFLNSELSYVRHEHINNQWQITNDDVMGGLSQGHVQLDNQAFVFSGTISTENNGGFTSTFTPIVKLAQNIKTIRIQVKGDGNPYQLRVRTKLMGFDLAYKVDFMTTANAIATLNFNFTDFKATFRGRMIGNAPILKPYEITHLGFLISAKKPKKFALSVLSVDFLH